MRCPNQAIKDTRIPVLRAEDIRAELASCEVFSKLDFRSAFHQLELAPESCLITVFSDVEELKWYTRRTMGTKPASGELSKALCPFFNVIPEAHMIHDDLIIATKSPAQHDLALERALAIIHDSGLTLNDDKCVFKAAEIPFWAMLISRDGVCPDPSKVEALKDALPPTNKLEVVSFLCMLHANAEFIPNLSRETVHLRALTQKHKCFKWLVACAKEFECLKTLFHEDAVFCYFNLDLPTYLFLDAHKSGLSAILSQGPSPDKAPIVACASRTTTPVERNYPQLDFEALSIDFALCCYC